jgi:hypothetical protein
LKVARFYSHLNGLEYLEYHYPELNQELSEVIAGVNAEACRTKVPKEARKRGLTPDGRLYSPIDLNHAFHSAMAARGWTEDRYSYFVTDEAELMRYTATLSREQQREAILQAGKTPIATYNQTDFVKNRVAVEVQFGKYSFVAYDMFVKHMAFYVGNKIDVGIEILPMKSMQRLMSSGIAYYEGELSNLVRQGRGVPAVPLLVLGIEPDFWPSPLGPPPVGDASDEDDRTDGPTD